MYEDEKNSSQKKVVVLKKNRIRKFMNAKKNKIIKQV